MQQKYEARYHAGKEFPLIALAGNISVALDAEAQYGRLGSTRSFFLPAGS